MKEIIEILLENMQSMKTELNDYQINQLIKFNEYLQEENTKYNLTAITDPKEVAIKHFLDSFYIAEIESFQNSNSIIDVGSGAGFPGIPLAIAYPNKQFVLVDSLRKRVNFINKLKVKIDLTNIKALHKRAEKIASEKIYRESFDFVTARAVAKMNVLSEYCLPLAKIGGVFVAMKLEGSDQEINNAKQAIELLGGEIKNTFQYSLPEDKQYELIVIEKVRNTPQKYPRRPGIPSKRPIN